MAKTIHTILSLRDRYTSTIRRIRGSTKDTEKQIKLLSNQVQSFRDRAVTGFADVARSARAAAVALGLVVAVAVGAHAGSFMGEVDTSLKKLKAQTGSTAGQMQEFKSLLTDMYKANYGESWSDLSSAMATAKQVTNQTGEALKRTTQNAVMYRDVFGEDVNASIKTADTMMRNFSITSDQAYALMAQGAQKGLNKSGDLLDTINEYSPYFSKLGFDANQMFDTLAAGLEAGAFNLDKVGDGIKEFGIRTKDGSKSSLEAYKTLKLNGSQMTAEFAAGGQRAQKAFLTTAKAIKEIKDPVVANAVSIQLFGTQAEDLEARVINAMGSARKQFDMTNDTMGQVSKDMQSGFGSAFKSIKRDLETGLLIPLGEKLAPKMHEFSDWIKSNMPQIKSAIETAFSAAGTAANALGDAYAWVKDNASWLTPVVIGLTAAIVAQKIVTVVSTAYKTWRETTQKLSVAQALLNTVMAANPFGLVALAVGVVVAAGVALWQNWDTVKAKASELWTWIKGVWDNMSTATADIFTGLVDSVGGIFMGIVDVVKKPFNFVIELINQLIDKINGVSFTVPDWVPNFGGETFGANIPKIPAFATGTHYFKGGLARTDEHGGEIKEYPNGTRIIPHDLSKRMLGGSGGVTINLTIQGNVIGNEEFINQVGNVLVGRVKTALGNA